MEAPAESASVKRESDAVANKKERARLRLRVVGKRGQEHEMQDVLELQAKARLEPRMGQKRGSTQLLPELEEEVTSTIRGGSSFSADVLVDSSVATSVSVEDMVQTDVPTSASVANQPARVQLEYFPSMKARPNTLKLTNRC